MNGKIKRKLVVFLLFQVIFLGVSGFLFYSNQSFLKETLQEEEKAHNLKLKLLSYDKVKEEYGKLGSGGRKVAQRFTSEEQAVNFIREIEEAAAGLNVNLAMEIYKPATVASSKNKKKTEEEGKEELAFILETDSSFNDFMRFLTRLENLDKYSVVRRVGLEKRVVRLRSDQGSVEKEILKGEIIVAAK